jgi:restriction system protein
MKWVRIHQEAWKKSHPQQPFRLRKMTRKRKYLRSRDGVIPIELVNGERLVELFESKQLGPKRREVFEVDHACFDQYR